MPRSTQKKLKKNTLHKYSQKPLNYRKKITSHVLCTLLLLLLMTPSEKDSSNKQVATTMLRRVQPFARQNGACPWTTRAARSRSRGAPRALWHKWSCHTDGWTKRKKKRVHAVRQSVAENKESTVPTGSFFNCTARCSA